MHATPLQRFIIYSTVPLVAALSIPIASSREVLPLPLAPIRTLIYFFLIDFNEEIY
jgi:hypothetical protein